MGADSKSCFSFSRWADRSLGSPRRCGRTPSGSGTVTSLDGSAGTTGRERDGLVMGFDGRRTAAGAVRFFEVEEAPDFFPVSFRDVFLGTALLLFELTFGRRRAFANCFRAFLGREVEGFFLSFFLLAIRLQHRSPPASPVWSRGNYSRRPSPRFLS